MLHQHIPCCCCQVRVPGSEAGGALFRYVPNRKTAFEFPDEYPEPEVSIAVDANILERPEPPAPAALERFERE